MGKHTPAPWFYKNEPYEDGSPYCFIWSGHENKDISFLAKGHFEICGVMKEADARLMAAAPDMLEALKDAHAYIHNDKLRARIGSIICKAEA